MWRAIQGTPVRRRMLQFQHGIEDPATPTEHSTLPLKVGRKDTP
jgi:hypothetical protein